MATVTVTLSKSNRFLVITEVAFKDGFQDGDLKRGILMVEEGTNPSEVLKKAQQASLTLGDEEDENGFYKVYREK